MSEGLINSGVATAELLSNQSDNIIRDERNLTSTNTSKISVLVPLLVTSCTQSINMMILDGMGCHPLPVHFTNVMHVVERLIL